MKTHTTLKLTVAALALALVRNLSAQPPTTASAAQTTESESADLGSMNVSICYEAFSLPIAKAGDLQRKGLTDEELYKEFVHIGKLERLLVLRAKTGGRATSETENEYTYPVEFTQPLEPGGVIPPEKTKPSAPVAATAFNQKHLGDTLEFEAKLSLETRTVACVLHVSHSALVKREKWGQGVSEVEQPNFELQELTTSFSASVGSPRLIGTVNPPFANGVTPRTEQNVWFCFVTATVVKNNAAPQKRSAR